MKQFTVVVFANLQPSQVLNKIIPLSRSKHVRKVIILRKEYMQITAENVTCLSIPGFWQIRPFYWIFVPFYGIYLVRKFKADLILNYNIFPHGFNAFFVSTFTKIPVIFSDINRNTIRFHQKKSVRFLINKILSNAYYLLVPGSKTEKYWKGNGFDRVAVLHSTIDINHFTGSNSEEKCYDFIFVGRFDENKRPDMLVQAFAKVRKGNNDASLCLAGKGPLENDLRKKVIDLGLQDHITLVFTDLVADYLRKSRVFIMSSQSEGLPCALLEAMACGVIPVVPDVGNISDVVKTGYNGALYDGSPEQLIYYMHKYLVEYDALEELRINARKTIVEEHSYEVATRKWDELLSKFQI